MAWTLSTWLLFVRIWQLLAAIVAAGMNGFLTARVWREELGLTQAMAILELLICVVLVYTTIVMFVQHTGGRSKRKGWLIAIIVFDILFCAVDLAIVTLLARAGLPDHCRGLTRTGATTIVFDLTPDPSGRPPSPVMTGFGDGSGEQYGRLDPFCGLERSFYVIALALVFTYMLTIVLGSLGIYETSHTKNTKVNELLDSLERAKDDIDLKPLDSASCGSTRAPRFSLGSPLSEGIITRTASLRSTLTSFTASTISHRPNAIARRPVPQMHKDHPPLPSQRPPLPKPGSLTSTGLGGGFVPVPLDEESAETALIADGMQHSQQRSPLQQTQRTGSPSSSQYHQQQGMPMLPEEEQTAESALVSDGMRPEPMLPPYEPPRGQHMLGHGEESNDMRLSEYVKGGTRAQDMKDEGRY